MNNLSSCPKNGKGLKGKKKMKKVKVLGQGGRGVSSLDLMGIFNKKNGKVTSYLQVHFRQNAKICRFYSSKI